MKTFIKYSIITLLIFISFTSCKKEKEVITIIETVRTEETTNDSRVSLKLNDMQKQHQLSNMRSHLEAVQTLITLIANDEFDKASKVAYSQLGSTTEMKLMCASFGNKKFENMGLNFHKDADQLSEILKTKDKTKSLQALSKTMNSCISCHATFRQ